MKLNRGYGADGKVTVAPQLVFNAPGWDARAARDIGEQRGLDRELRRDRRATPSTSRTPAGCVQGWDISALAEGGSPTRVFRFWTGDDTDASVVVDDEGMLYVGVRVRAGQRALQARSAR